MTVEAPTRRPSIAAPRSDLIARLEARARAAAPNATETLTITAPFTGETIAEVPRGTPEDVANAAAKAREAQRAWATTPVKQRAEVLLRFHDLVLAKRDEVLDLLQLEGGKARIHGYEEVLDAAVNARYYANTAPKLLSTKRRRGALPLLTQAFEHHHPRGIVGFIVPWNYPLALGVSDMLPALVAGNGAVVKPDQHTPLSPLWAAELLEEAGLPKGLVQVVTGAGSQLGEPIIDAVDFVMFTGSTRVGRTVAAQAGERLKECSMELGGKNAMIVLPDADIKRTALGAMRAAWTNAGQLCISMERLYVHEDIADELTDALAERTKTMRLGSGLSWDFDMGSLISEKQLETVQSHVDDAKAKGAKIVAGGKARPDLGPLFYEPTILADVTPEMTVYAEETFGPVLSVYTFSDADDAIARANATNYGLNASIWTRDTAKAKELATRIESGTVNVNEGYSAAWGSVDAPMGGFKESGFGRRHGEHGLTKYTQAQTVAVQRLLPLSTPPTRDAKQRALILVTGLRALKRLPFVR